MLKELSQKQILTYAVIIGGAAVIVLTGLVLTRGTNFLPIATLPASKPVLNFVSKQTSTAWLTYTNPAFGYSLSYPPEFTVEDRGKVGKLASLVAFNYQDGNKRITVAKAEISSGKSPTTMEVSKGKDGNGNDVATYTFPYTATKTLTLTGTIWPTVNSSFLFGQVLDQMAASVKVTAK